MLYTPHSRRTSTNDIVKMYVEKKEALKRWFLCNKQRVSMTTDIWVSQTTGCTCRLILSMCFAWLKSITYSLRLIYIYRC